MRSDSISTITSAHRIAFFVLADIVLSVVSLLIAHQLAYVDESMPMIVLVTAINVFFIFLFRGYRIVWNYFALQELRNLVLALLLSHILFVIISYWEGMFSGRVVVINFAFYLLSLIALRSLKRIYKELYSVNQSKDKPTMILIGASYTLQALIKDNASTYNIKAILDDEEQSQNSYISNIKVRSLADFESIITKDDEIIITKELPYALINQLFIYADRIGNKNIKLSKPAQGNTNHSSYNIKKISIEDLLAREPKDFDREKTASFIAGKTILITGAGGSIGSEIARQCVSFGASEILLLDHSEYNLYTIGEECKELGYTNYHLLLKNVTHKESMQEVFTLYRPQILIHAAAYKHVNIVQTNIKDSVINNIIGTKNCVDLAIEHGLQLCVLISTDKAIRPTGIMGATKRICELYAQNVPSKNTIISSVRFGNVLDSSGSVIPKFKSQIKKNKPLSVTHKDVTRYFMLISEACELTLQAGSLAKGGEVFVLDMGEPIKIIDLAKKMLKLYNKEHLGVQIIGLQKGEKLYEELLFDNSDIKTKYQSIIIAKQTKIDITKLTEDIAELTTTNPTAQKIKEIVPEFSGA